MYVYFSCPAVPENSFPVVPVDHLVAVGTQLRQTLNRGCCERAWVGSTKMRLRFPNWPILSFVSTSWLQDFDSDAIVISLEFFFRKYCRRKIFLICEYLVMAKVISSCIFCLNASYRSRKRIFSVV